MTQGPDHAEDEEDRLFSEYGELVLLLDADPQVLHEPIKDASPEQKKRIIGVLEDQINDTYLEGNEKLVKRFMYLWMFTIRQLDEDVGVDEQTDGFALGFEDWEHDQFY